MDETSVRTPADLQALHVWASNVLVRPVTVQYRSLHNILFAFLGIFFIGMSLLMIVVNGFTGAAVLLLPLNVALLLTLYFIWSRAQRKAAITFDRSGVTRGDKTQFSWNELTSVDYLMVIRQGGRREGLWRIEIVFKSGVAWIVPVRVKNLPEIRNLVSSIPTIHQKRLAKG